MLRVLKNMDASTYKQIIYNMDLILKYKNIQYGYNVT